MPSSLTAQDELSGVNPSAGATPLAEPEALSRLSANAGFPLTGQLENNVDDKNIQEKTVNVSMDYKDMGKYLIALSGRMLENLDEIYDSDSIVKSGTTDTGYVFTNSKKTLELDCLAIASAGIGFCHYHENIEEEFGSPPEIIIGKQKGDDIVVEDIDWDKLQGFLLKSREKFEEDAEHEPLDNFECDPRCFSEMAFVMSESGYGPNSTFLSKEVSLLVNPIKSN